MRNDEDGFKLKYTKPLLLFIIFTVPMSAIMGSVTGLSWVIILFPIFAMLGTMLGFVLAPFFLWVYKKFIGRESLFAIQEMPAPEKFYGMSQGIFPVLMSTNFALSLIFNPTIMSFSLFQDFYLEWNGIIFLFFILGALLEVASFTLFSAAWIILDSGIVTTNKEEVGIKPEPTELHSVGKWYLAFLEGYAGISVIIALYQFTFDFLARYGNQVHWSAIFFLFILPFIISVWVLPAIMLLNATYGKRRNFILNFGKRIGIENEFEMIFTRIEHGSS